MKRRWNELQSFFNYPNRLNHHILYHPIQRFKNLVDHWKRCHIRGKFYILVQPFYSFRTFHLCISFGIILRLWYCLRAWVIIWFFCWESARCDWDLNFSGIIIGIFAFIITGIFHPVVVKCEYYFSAKIWPLFLVAGILCAIISLIIENQIISGIFGILSFVLLWCIRELKEQTERVKKGWFPRNPNRKD